MSVSIVYVTAASRDDALRLGRAMVDERLAACANVLDGMTSVYRWEGAVREDQEVVLILKTRTELVGPLTERVRQLHPYDCPCVISWRVDRGNPDYLRWIENETHVSRDLIV
jgi:periplasmic divalent cation tolerance protein